MLIEAIKNAGSIAIGGHVRPDGDCVGSCLGVYLYVREQFPDKQIHVYLESIPTPFLFLEGADEISHEIPEHAIYDLFIALDCGDKGRLGFSAPLFDTARKTLCVDHHVSNEAFADENHIEPDASSTSELIYNLLNVENISRNVAECLYLGIVHDTGVFRHSCTHPSTMRVAASLMEKEINFTKIITETFDEKTYAQNQVMGYALVNSQLLLNGRGVASSVSRKEMEAYHVLPKQLDGIVNQLKLTKGADIAIFMYELENGSYKVSLRSTEAVDVSLVAGRFGGGGHARAAGFNMSKAVDEILKNLLPVIEEQL